MKYKKQLLIIIISYILLIVILHFIPTDILLIGDGVGTIVEFNKETGFDGVSYPNSQYQDLVAPK